MEITKMLTLSTAHLSQTTRESFDNGERCDLAVYPKTINETETSYGWFVYVPVCVQEHKIPTDLAKCLLLAQSLGCVVICFDSDAEPIDLEKYDD